MHTILFALWFFLPAGLANASPVFASRINFLRPLYLPIDLGKKFRGRRLLGKNKTWLGVFIAVLTGLVVIALQKYGFSHSTWLKSISGGIDYKHSIIWLLGPLLGFGAIFGDAIESFFKRQFRVKSGHTWIPFDQIDYIIGGLAFSIIVVRLSGLDYLLIIVIYVVLHIITSYVGYLLHLKSKPI